VASAMQAARPKPHAASVHESQLCEARGRQKFAHRQIAIINAVVTITVATAAMRMMVVLGCMVFSFVRRASGLVVLRVFGSDNSDSPLQRQHDAQIACRRVDVMTLTAHDALNSALIASAACPASRPLLFRKPSSRGRRDLCRRP